MINTQHKPHNNARRAIVFALLLAVSATGVAQVIVEGELTRIHESEPGADHSGSILLKNVSTMAEELRIYQTDYFFYADGRSLYDEVGSVTRSNGNWIDFFPRRFSIPAKGSVQVNYSIEVPEDPSLAGTFWSVLMVEILPPSSAASSTNDGDSEEDVAVGIQQVFRYGIQMVTHIGEAVAGRPEIIAARLLNEDTGKALQIDVENTGERWLRPTVWADLYDIEGNHVGKSRRALAACTQEPPFDSPSTYRRWQSASTKHW